MKSHYTFLAIGTTAFALAAGASSTFHPANNETGSITHAVPGKLTNTEQAALDRLEAQRIDPLWIQTPGEGGWQLRQHSYDFRNGRLVHTDTFAHDTPRPSIASQPDLPIYRELERD